MNKIGFRFRLLAGYLFLLLFFVGVVIYQLNMMNRATRQISLFVERKLIAEKNIRSADKIILTIHAEIWDALYLNSENRQLLKAELDRKAERFYTHLDSLMEYLPENRDELNDIRKLFIAYYIFSKSILDTAQLTELVKMADINQKFMDNKERMITKLDDTFGTITEEYEKALVLLNRQMMKERWILIIATVILVITGVILSFVMAEIQTRPVIQLTRLLGQMGTDGIENYNKTIAIKAGWEFQLLVNAFNELTRKLRFSFESLQNEVLSRKAAEEQVKGALLEKEALLRELYHRTRNNMQVVSAMLTVKTNDREVTGMKDMMNAIKGRIQAMALVHEKLYTSRNLSSINFKEYIADLISFLQTHYSIRKNKIQFIVDGDEILFLIDIAVPVGLVLYELLSNAVLHAFPGDRNGEVRVILQRNNESEILIVVTDNGTGFPESFNPYESETDGFKFINTLVVHQLQGAVSFFNRDGVSCSIQFHDKGYKARV